MNMDDLQSKISTIKNWLSQHTTIVVFMVALMGYIFFPALLGKLHSPSVAYYNYLAESFFHGRLDIQTPETYDLTFYNGSWYVPVPPLPALLMLPWAAVSGAEGVNTTLFGVAIGALNVSLVYWFLSGLGKTGLAHINRSGCLWLTLLFGFGSIHWFMSIQGSVWYLAQVCAATFMILSFGLAVRHESPLLPSIALALAMLGRPNLVLAYPLLLGIYLQKRAREGLRMRQILHWGVLTSLPLLASASLLLGYNAARFDNPLDFGYLHENIAQALSSDLRTYGQFNIHFIGRNLRTMLFGLPVLDTQGQLLPDPYGMSIFLTTPALVYLFQAWWKQDRRSFLVGGTWAALALIFLPIVTYYNTGWHQFGYRFSLDFFPCLLILLALTIGEKVSLRMRLLILLGVMVNLWGAAFGPQW